MRAWPCARWASPTAGMLHTGVRLMRYRIPLEFEAENDDAARAHAKILDEHELDEHDGLVRLVLSELTRGETYWQKVDPK